MSTDSVINSRWAVTGESSVFDGTDVPVKKLFERLNDAHNLYVFLHEFPVVRREQALEALQKKATATALLVIHSDQTVQGGTPVFKGTDVSVKTLFDYLAKCDTLKDFHYDFPSVFPGTTYDAIVTAKELLEIGAYRGKDNGVIHSDRDFVSGTPVFVGTRLPMHILFDFLADTQSLKDFFYEFPGASHRQLEAVLELARDALEKEANAASA